MIEAIVVVAGCRREIQHRYLECRRQKDWILGDNLKHDSIAGACVKPAHDPAAALTLIVAGQEIRRHGINAAGRNHLRGVPGGTKRERFAGAGLISFQNGVGNHVQIHYRVTLTSAEGVRDLNQIGDRAPVIHRQSQRGKGGTKSKSHEQSEF